VEKYFAIQSKYSKYFMICQVFFSKFKKNFDKYNGSKLSDRIYRGAINGAVPELYIETNKSEVRLLRK